MGLKPWEMLKATKPAFGDVRAPRHWYDVVRISSRVFVGVSKVFGASTGQLCFLEREKSVQ